MSCRTAAPAAPAAFSAASPWRWMIRSTALVGVNRRRPMTSPKASMFGASIAASRAASRAWREQQPAVLRQHPAHRPRHVVARVAGDVRHVEAVAHDRDARARHRLRDPGPSSPSPKCSDLNLVSRSAGVTWSKSGVSASYISACCVGSGRRRYRPVLARRDDVASGGGVILGRGGRGEERERRRGDCGDPGHPRDAIRSNGYDASHATSGIGRAGDGGRAGRRARPRRRSRPRARASTRSGRGGCAKRRRSIASARAGGSAASPPRAATPRPGPARSPSPCARRRASTATASTASSPRPAS